MSERDCLHILCEPFGGVAVEDGGDGTGHVQELEAAIDVVVAGEPASEVYFPGGVPVIHNTYGMSTPIERMSSPTPSLLSPASERSSSKASATESLI